MPNESAPPAALLQQVCDRMILLRRDLHAHPETAFEERRTSDLVAEHLRNWGLEVHRCLAKTGVIGTLTNGQGPTIGLRADMDALALSESTGLPYASTTPGRMHACGHDGHTAMLLGAACYLAQSRGFQGTVHFIFQPAEENLAGGKVMVDEGLFKRFPMQAVFGMHNRPGMEVGTMGIRSGPVMAAADFFELRILGRGGHAAYPHTAIDPILIAAQIIQSWQTLVSRTTDPLEAAVVSVTRIHGGETTNVIPELVELAGTVRSFRDHVQHQLETGMRRIAECIAAANGARVELTYDRRYRATENHPEQTAQAIEAMRRSGLVNEIHEDIPPTMGAEDFGWMLAACPGAYAVIGNGIDGPHARPLHNPGFDFNDAVLPVGIDYWVNLARLMLTADIDRRDSPGRAPRA